MNFYTYLTELIYKYELETEFSELVEAKGSPRLSRGKHGNTHVGSGKIKNNPKLRKVKKMVSNPEISSTPFLRTTYIGEPDVPKPRENKSDPTAIRKKGRGEIKDENSGWTRKTVFNHETGGTDHVFTETKTGRTLTFDGDSHNNYLTNFSHLMSFSDIHEFINPGGKLMGDVRVTSYADDPQINISMNGPNKNVPEQNRYNLDVTLKKETDKLGNDHLSSVHINHAYIPESKQHNGVFREHFKRLVSHWSNIGVKKMELLADIDVGGYAWAKYGFDFANKADLTNYRDGFKKYLKEKGATVDNVDSMEHSWDIANAKVKGYKGKYGEDIGKEFMLHFSNLELPYGETNGWSGVLNLEKGSLSKLQMESYLNGKVLSPEFKTLYKGTEKELMGEKTPEAQIQMMTSDRIRNNTVAGNLFLKKGMTAEAEASFKSALSHAEIFSAVAKTMEPGLAKLLMGEVAKHTQDIPMDYRGSHLSNPSETTQTAIAINDPTYGSVNPVIAQRAANLGFDISPISTRQRVAYSLGLHSVAGLSSALNSATPVHQLPLDLEEALIKDTQHSQETASSKTPAVAKALKKTQDKVRKGRYETFVVIDADGKTVMEKSGVRKAVLLTEGECYTLKGKVTVHNHPSDSAFSLQDIMMACTSESAESRVAGNGGTTYSIKPKDVDGKPVNFSPTMKEAIFDAYDTTRMALVNSPEFIAKRSSVSSQEEMDAYQKEIQDKIWEITAKKTGLVYKRMDGDGTARKRLHQKSKKETKKIDDVVYHQNTIDAIVHKLKHGELQNETGTARFYTQPQGDLSSHNYVARIEVKNQGQFDSLKHKRGTDYEFSGTEESIPFSITDISKLETDSPAAFVRQLKAAMPNMTPMERSHLDLLVSEAELPRAATPSHKEVVKKAIKEGKNVHQDTVKDYPDVDTKGLAILREEPIGDSSDALLNRLNQKTSRKELTTADESLNPESIKNINENKNSGASESFLTDLHNGKGGVLKPDSGTVTTGTNPSGSEASAYEISEILGLGLVPATKRIDLGETGFGSHQKRIEDLTTMRDMEYEYGGIGAAEFLKKLRDNNSADTLAQATAFDDIIGEGDRNVGNFGVDSQGSLWLIDHNHAFLPNFAPNYDNNGNEMFDVETESNFGQMVKTDRGSKAYKDTITKAHKAKDKIRASMEANKVKPELIETTMNRIDYLHRRYVTGEYSGKKFGWDGIT